MKLSHLGSIAIVICIACNAASAQTYDLQKLLKEKKLVTAGKKVVPLTEPGKSGVSMTGISWIEGLDFSTGTIDIDLRGKDVVQKSFIGIAFHGVDTITHDVVYFRPFNFRSPDPVRKIHAVQYVSHPEFTWDRLREERNGVFEKGIDPPPLATDWFHAKIEVTTSEVIVYVNGSSTPSLRVKKLNERVNGKIGLWNEALDGDFANLTITKR
ncbi:MAG TPA: hypothetical protein VK666_11910 [Chryseolinea sp.]|nr:hypothetical protein [Chryseolinea sp.]